MKAYFNKDKFVHWVELNPNEMDKDDFKDKKHWSSVFNEADITRYKETANEIEREKHNIDSVFVVPRYNDFGEITETIIIHPDWVDWRKDGKV